MSSSWAFGLFVILVLGSVCEPSEDDLQRPLTPGELEEMMWQRPVLPDPSDFLKAQEMDVSESEEVTNFHPEDAPRGPMLFGPRSMGRNAGPEIHFPPSFPSLTNLKDICEFSKASIRYPEDMFPPSGFGVFHRKADAVNRLQPWFGMCCGLNGTQAEMLCCAEQAWKKTLSAFCAEEFSIKTVAYFCCKKNGKAKWSCFDKEAPSSSYDIPIVDINIKIPQKVQGFKYNPNSCKGISTASPSKPKKKTGIVDISFPPGRPHSSNIALICAHRKIRPRYLTRCLPRTGYGWLARQSKAINMLEKEYSQCCKETKGKHQCAEKKWKKAMDKFCKDEKKTKGKHFECCDKKKGEELYSCFASAAPDPAYSDSVSSPPAAPVTLESFCDIHTSLQNMTDFPFSVDGIAGRCCHLVLQERSSCIETELKSSLNGVCEVKNLEKPHCCESTVKNRARCATKLLVRYMTKANKIKFSVKKKCPLTESQDEHDM